MWGEHRAADNGLFAMERLWSGWGMLILLTLAAVVWARLTELELSPSTTIGRDTDTVLENSGKSTRNRTLRGPYVMRKEGRHGQGIALL